MKAVVVTHKTEVKPESLNSNYFGKDSIGFWGTVTAVDSLTNTVSVMSATRYEYTGLPVVSSEWVTVDDKKNYIPSQRNLPPVNSRVFVLVPNGNATSAFVLCSGFSRGDENIRKLWAQDESELESKNNCRETKTQGGWDIQEEYANGNFSVVSNDKKISLKANPAANGESQPKEVSLEAWANKITITADGITVVDKSGNKVEATSSGLLIKDVNKNEIKTTSSGVEIKADETKKIKIGNATDTIKGILTDIITVLNGLRSAVSGETATVVPGQFTTVIAKINQILE